MKRRFILLAVILISFSFLNTSFAQDSTNTQDSTNITGKKDEPAPPILSNTAEKKDTANSQEQKPLTAADVQKAFENALKQVAAEKDKEDAKTLVMLKERLRHAAREWTESTKRRWENNLNKYVDQKWETLVKFGDPAHYDYYLRNFSYDFGSTDIIKTDSLAAPYKGSMIVTEKLYVERYHTPNASNVTVFFYTFIAPMKLNFEYRDDKFSLIGTEAEEPYLENGWPGEIIEYWEKSGQRFMGMTSRLARGE